MTRSKESARCPFLSQKLHATEVQGDVMDLVTTATASLHGKSNAEILSFLDADVILLFLVAYLV